jgi:uncharacterized delta-60 repeat protein
MIASRLLLSLTLLVSAAGSAAACPSDFDNFGNNGRSEQPQGLGGDGKDVETAPNGSVYVAGSAGGKPAVIRYTSTGNVDDTFGEDGVAALHVAGEFRRLALLANGSILAVGTVQVRAVPGKDVFVPATFLARFDSSGELDESFGDDGTTLVRFGDESEPSGLLVRGNGSIVVVGRSRTAPGLSQATVFFFTAGGDLSAELGGARALPGFNLAAANAITETANDSLLLAMTDHSGDGGTVYIVRMNSFGALDASFGMGGFRRIRSPKVIDEASGIAVDDNGRIYVSGTSVPPDRPRRMRDFVRRFSAGGGRDNSYGVRGLAKVRPGGRWVAHDLDVSGDGVATLPSSRSKVGSIVIRFGADGKVDRAFGHLGITGILVEHLEGIHVQADGKIATAGTFEGKPIVVRFEGGEWDGEEACVEDCGNGAVEVMEECDDANVTNGDGCSAACLAE